MDDVKLNNTALKTILVCCYVRSSHFPPFGDTFATIWSKNGWVCMLNVE